MHQNERVDGARMATGTRCHGNNAVHTGFGRLAGMLLVGHVMEHHPAVAVHRLHHLAGGAQGGDDNGHLVFNTQFQVCLPARIGPVHNQVHGVGRRFCFRIGASERGKLVIHLDQPVFKAFAGALVQSRETANDALLAAGERQFRPRDQKHGCGHQGQ